MRGVFHSSAFNIINMKTAVFPEVPKLLLFRIFILKLMPLIYILTGF
jgi:hypothetical protein